MSSVRRFDTPTRVLAGLVERVRRLERRVERHRGPLVVPRARVELTDSEAHPANQLQAVSFHTAVYNVGGMWTAGQPSRLTAPVSGVYFVSAGFSLTGDLSAEDEALLGIRRNGDNSGPGYLAVQQPRTLADPSGSVSTDVLLEAGDYVEAVVRLYSAGLSLFGSVRTFLTARWVAPPAAADDDTDYTDQGA